MSVEIRVEAVACGLCIDEEGRVLLVRRSLPPEADKWSLPGGYARAGELLASTVKRELQEETGLAVEVGGALPVFEYITPDAHLIIHTFRCSAHDTNASAGSDAADAGWFSPSAFADIETTDEFLRVALAEV